MWSSFNGANFRRILRSDAFHKGSVNGWDLMARAYITVRDKDQM